MGDGEFEDFGHGGLVGGEGTVSLTKLTCVWKRYKRAMSQMYKSRLVKLQKWVEEELQ